VDIAQQIQEELDHLKISKFKISESTGNTLEKYFTFDQVNSMSSPNFEDIFY
jgi:hypothetical protein